MIWLDKEADVFMSVQNKKLLATIADATKSIRLYQDK